MPDPTPPTGESETARKPGARVTPIFASGEYLSLMCDEVDRLRAEVAGRTAEIAWVDKRYRLAIEQRDYAWRERDAAEARIARLEEALRTAVNALREVRKLHIEINDRAGRSPTRSHTIRTIDEALARNPEGGDRAE